MYNRLITIFILASLFSACDVNKKHKKTSGKNPGITLDTVSVGPQKTREYQASETRKYDILHTKLNVKFNYDSAQMSGEATLTIKPYFYSIRSIDLNARGFTIRKVALSKKDDLYDLKYRYEKDVISIALDKQYSKNDSFNIFISYISNPNKLEKGGSAAINNDKGLYFINPDGKDSLKPIQIWTQGETQSNSAWFPTFDHPNERMTEEICMRVKDKYTTLSNGELYFQLHNTDSTRTDCWKMDFPIAPYLVMMAVGDYAIVKDKWRDKEVNYYVEKKYLPDAKQIFGKTPAMIEFFSKTLGVAYPWNKYSQIVVRDYVSGAMENTTATIHGEFLQQTRREMIDGDHEDIIAHELFHQWFGDYVTCESWSNLPLNESFATYGEYLWFEYSEGRDMADDHLWSDLIRYQQESRTKQENLIRFYYDDREDMFDGHSYQKGGRVLHMLRKYVGDEAFFASLKLYLEKNKFNSVEMHQLRLAFEEVTGEDLNWFFNQWCYSSGHPKLTFSYSFDDVNKKQHITIAQQQDLTSSPLFKLPILVDLYFPDTVIRHKITISKTNEEFTFDANTKPLLVNVDAEKMLLCDKEEYKTTNEWIYQYKHAPLYLDRAEAIYALGKNEQQKEGNNTLIKYSNEPSFLIIETRSNRLKKTAVDSLAALTLLDALSDRSPDARQTALELLDKNTSPVKGLKEKLILLVESDKKSRVRALALEVLVKKFPSDELLPLLNKGMQDSSYAVISKALKGLVKLNKEEALKRAAVLEKEENQTLLLSVANVYSEIGSDKNNEFFVILLNRLEGWSRVTGVNTYGKFLERCNDETINKGLVILENIGRTTEIKWEKFYVQQTLSDLAGMYFDREKEIQGKIDNLKDAKTNGETVLKLERDLEPIKLQKEKILKLYDALDAVKTK